MILWTVQHIAAWKQLDKYGVYSVPDEYIWPYVDRPWPQGMYAYQWMAKRLEELVCPPPEGVHYPVWAYYR